jgi:hypothetical protein
MSFFQLLVATTFLVTSQATCNNLSTDSLTNSAHTAINSYLTNADAHALIFSGREHVKYPLHYINHPWLHSPDFTNGTLYVNNKVYPNLNMKLDQFKDELVISPPNSPFSIVVLPAYVDSAVLHGLQLRHFSSPNGSFPAGYALLLVDGDYQLYQKNQLLIRDVINSGILTTRFETLAQFWIHKNNTFYNISTIRDVYRLFPEQRSTIRTYARQQRLNFRNDRSNALSQLVTFLNQQ